MNLSKIYNKTNKLKMDTFDNHINENFEVHYSDGIRAAKKFKSEKDARAFMSDAIENKKGLQEIAIYKAGSGFHSTADTKAVISFWGEGSYLDNVSKKDSKLAAKKLEESLTERHITVKRKYTENHPAIKVGKAAKIRNKVLEAIKDGKITKEEFNTILREMTTDSGRWMRRNSTYLNVSEDGITLSKTGKRVLNELTPVVNTPDINEKASAFKIANANAEEIFGEFGIATLAYDEIARVINIKRADKLAKKYGEDSFMALTELDMEELLNKNPKLVIENKQNDNMKTNFIFESFKEFTESLNEAARGRFNIKSLKIGKRQFPFPGIKKTVMSLWNEEVEDYKNPTSMDYMNKPSDLKKVKAAILNGVNANLKEQIRTEFTNDGEEIEISLELKHHDFIRVTLRTGRFQEYWKDMLKAEVISTRYSGKGNYPETTDVGKGSVSPNSIIIYLREDGEYGKQISHMHRAVSDILDVSEYVINFFNDVPQIAIIGSESD
jgi:hypothetical protein